MYCFFASRKAGNTFILEGSELKHLKVRRLRPGDSLGIFFDEDLYLCKLEEVSKRHAVCSVVKKLDPQTPRVDLTLFQCVPVHLKTFEFIIQKAVELGVSKIVPVISSRSFQDVSVISSKLKRWEKLVKEAMKQANRARHLVIEKPVLLTDLEPLGTLPLLLDNFRARERLSCDVLKNSRNISIVVGPEGGFREDEIDLLISKGFKPVRLEHYILRTETASLIACGIIMNFADY